MYGCTLNTEPPWITNRTVSFFPMCVLLRKEKAWGRDRNLKGRWNPGPYPGSLLTVSMTLHIKWEHFGSGKIYIELQILKINCVG